MANKEKDHAGTDPLTIVATEAITKNRFVTYDGKHTVDISATGVALFDTDSGSPISVQAFGRVPVEAAGAISAGAWVSSDASGKAVSLTLSAVADIAKICGKAVEAANADGDLILVDLKPL